MVICLRAREEFTDNRFQLLFIYVDYIPLYIYINIEQRTHSGVESCGEPI